MDQLRERTLRSKTDLNLLNKDNLKLSYEIEDLLEKKRLRDSQKQQNAQKLQESKVRQER